MVRLGALEVLALLGAHVSVAGGLALAFDRGEELQCRAIQIFVKNANRWQARPLTDDEVAAFRARRQASPVGPVLAHASYLINLCATEPAILERSHRALADELDRCCRLGVDGLVVHPGAHLGAGEEAGIERVAGSIAEVLARAPAGPTRLLLENTAGQGTVLGHRLEHLAAIRERLARPDRLGVCLDTCHAFAAGYAIHEPAGYEDFWAAVERLFGGGALCCVHVNDSLRPFASRRDRHAHIGEGEMGLAVFERLVGDRRLAGIPLILETEPGENRAGHRRDLEVLRGLSRRVDRGVKMGRLGGRDTP